MQSDEEAGVDSATSSILAVKIWRMLVHSQVSSLDPHEMFDDAQA